LDHQNIPRSILPPALWKKETIEAIGTLTAYLFVTRQKDLRTFDMHRLVNLATRNWLGNEGILSIWMHKALIILAERIPSGGHKVRIIWTPYLPHAIHIVACPEISDSQNSMKIRLLDNVGRCLYSNGQYKEAEKLHRQTLELRIKAMRLEDAKILTSMYNLVEALSHQGKWKEVETLHRKTLELRRKALGSEDVDVLSSMTYLAETIKGAGRYKEVEQMHRGATEYGIK
jgi:tetratricopeptide (TPR) repeat protein